MAKQPTVGAKTDSEVLKWLRGKGYPFELETGRRLLRAGFNSIAPSPLYPDPETGKLREIDIFATVEGDRKSLDEIPDDSSAPPVVDAVLAVECKDCVGRPWVVLGAADQPDYTASPYHAIPDGLAKDMWGDHPSWGSMFGKSLVGDLAMVGHGIVQMQEKGSDKDLAYEAVVKAANAALGRCRQNEARLTGFQLWPALELVFPVAVVRGQLFAFSVDHSGKESLAEVEEAKVLLRHPTTGELIAVSVVASDHLDTFAKSAADGLRALCADLAAAAPEAVESFNKRREYDRLRKHE